MSQSTETEGAEVNEDVVEEPVAAEVDAPEATAEADETPAAPQPRVAHVKERRGVVVSAKMQKTVVVRVERRVKHRKYKKYVRIWKRYLAHDEIGCQEGDLVLIHETRPLSKSKRWKIVRQLGRDA